MSAPHANLQFGKEKGSTMKRYLVSVMAIAALAASSALATQIKTGNIWGPYQAGSGGEFTLTVVSGLDLGGYAANTTGFNNNAGLPSFQSFCLENSQPPEYINLNTTYNAVTNTRALNGGVGPGGDPVSVGTGWLYSQFATGTLAGYNYGSGRTTSAGLLQNAIWWLEGEGVAYNSGNTFMLAAVTQFGSQASARADGAAAYGVSALNLTTLTGALAQDQLYFRPVPDNALTVILLGTALAALALMRRR
jgi:hypothetical protein